MSTVYAYSLHDTKALTYSAPFYQPTDGAAVRVIEEIARDPNTTVGRYPADYRLYRVGSFDTDTGVLMGLVAPAFIIDCLAILSGGSAPDHSA